MNIHELELLNRLSRRILRQFHLPYHRSEINEYSDEKWDKL